MAASWHTQKKRKIEWSKSQKGSKEKLEVLSKKFQAAVEVKIDLLLLEGLAGKMLDGRNSLDLTGMVVTKL